MTTTMEEDDDDGWDEEGEEGHLNFYSCILEIDCLKYIILKWAIKLLLSTPLNLSRTRIIVWDLKSQIS